MRNRAGELNQVCVPIDSVCLSSSGFDSDELNEVEEANKCVVRVECSAPAAEKARHGDCMSPGTLGQPRQQ